MKLNEIRDNQGARKPRLRVGRGIGSTKGKTAGRGVKGQKARTGVALYGFEGGQMPLHRRLPKRGFKNPSGRDFAEVNLGRLQAAIDAGALDSKQPIDAAALVASGVLRRARDGVRLLATGELKAKVSLKLAGASKAAVAAVEAAGGAVELPKPVEPKKSSKKAARLEAAKAACEKAAKAAEEKASEKTEKPAKREKAAKSEKPAGEKPGKAPKADA
ncbi:MAG: 50S ribosomal protein L15 [Proteobacteria bacterium]|nr:50S ribosomal protein L15 [Pseudomonadota bacterium]MBI3496745.1 50S ribosomal protein L15 [Pseudomonadota bacterium]